MASLRGVVLVELAGDRVGAVVDRFGRAAGGERDTSSFELAPPLRADLVEDGVALVLAHRVLEAVGVRPADVVHDRGAHGPDAAVDLGGAEREPAAAADPDDADPVAVQEGRVPRKSTAALKSSVKISGDELRRGSPPLSPL